MTFSLKILLLILQATIILALPSALSSKARRIPNLPQNMDEKCKEKIFFFERNPNYPQEIINRLQTEKYNSTLRITMKFPEFPVKRINNDKDVQCETITKKTEIYQIIDEDMKVRFVVQSQHFKQIMDVEQCTKPNTPSYKSPRKLHSNITCVQETLPYKFLVLTHDGKDFESVNSLCEVPVCCHLKLNGYE